MVLAEHLRAARTQAKTLNRPVGVFFPRTAQGISRSSYTVSGAEEPVVTGNWLVANEFPDASLFLGFWGSGFSLQTDGLQPADWGATGFQDPGLIFHPSGDVSSNIPSLDKSFFIVANSGFQVSPANLGSQSTFRLDGVRDPETVVVTTSGSIKTVASLPHGDSVQRLESFGGLPKNQLPPPPTANSPQPAMRDIRVAPLTLDLPPGIDALCHPRGSLTLTTTVEDPNGDSLVCWWESDPPAGLSKLAPTKMIHKGGGLWEAVIEWAPPPGAQPADIFTLTCFVADGFGNNLQGTIGAAGRVQITPRDKLTFVNDRYGNHEVFTCNLDGSDLRRVTRSDQEEQSPRWARDGSRVFFFKARPGTNPRDGLGDIFSCEPDGSDLLQITNSQAWGMDGCMFPFPSPDGLRITFLGKHGSKLRSYIVALDGTDPFNPSVHAPRPLGPELDTDGLTVGTAWHPAGRYVVVSSSDPGGIYKLTQYRIDGSEPPVVLTASLPQDFYEEPDFSPDGTKICFAAGVHSIVADWSATGISNVFKTQSDIRAPSFSPGGDKLMITRKNSGVDTLYTCNLQGQALEPIQIPGGGNTKHADWTIR